MINATRKIGDGVYLIPDYSGRYRVYRNKKYRLLPAGLTILKSMVDEGEQEHLSIAAYGKMSRFELLERIGKSLAK